MGKKSGPKAPAAPDPTVVSQAQSAANIETAREQQRLNMINSHGPGGSVTYAADPNAPGGYSQNINLSPEQQRLYNLQSQGEVGAAQLGLDQLGRVGQALQTPLNTAGLPTLHGGGQLSVGQGVQTSFDKGGPLQYGFNQGGQVQYNFDPGQSVQGSVGGNLDAARQQAQNAAFAQATSRLDPMYQQGEDRMRSRLAAQGWSDNSEGTSRAVDDFNRGKTDAYNQAIYSSIGAGNDAAQQLFNQQLAQGQFANQAAGQMYGQNLGAAQFANQAAGQDYQQNLGAAQFNNNTAGQDYQQNLGAAQFNNTAQQQIFQQEMDRAQLANSARQQGLQERAYLQNQPIDQMSALLNMGQVQMPQGVQYTPTQVGQTDVLGAYGLQQQAQQAAYQAQQARSSGMMGGLFSLGAAALMGSDRRLKTDIRRVGTRPDGLGVYLYRYKGGGPEHFGVMAQEVEKVRPDAVVRRADGMRAVNYFALEAA